eukprot:gnl/TRDRNA2_/TRDRNA2_93879_c0_seq1.p1 gnl/TRDRNA2_/TRDRNA2_93879_c0~~gnl/TRDRNA2_/TRDRNA2_93879_c0_seq1.p1  ORF type:complete len:678 (-),score=138.54 gnl/TRDRNA2_/TRDRNA2_93879_c0_seq1:26-1969(-)
MASMESPPGNVPADNIKTPLVTTPVKMEMLDVFDPNPVRATLAERPAWDQQASALNCKLAEVMQSHWALCRDQVGAMSQELVSMRSDNEGLKIANQHLAKELQEQQNVIHPMQQRLQLEVSKRERLEWDLERVRLAHEAKDDMYVQLEKSITELDRYDEETRLRVGRLRVELDEETRLRKADYEGVLEAIRIEAKDRADGIAGAERNLDSALKRLDVVLFDHAAVKQTLEDLVETVSKQNWRAALDDENRSRRADKADVLDALRDESKQRAAAIESMVKRFDDLAQMVRNQSTEQLEQHQDLKSALDEETKCRKAEHTNMLAALRDESKQRAAAIESAGKKSDAAASGLENRVQTVLKQSTELLEKQRALRLALDEETASRTAENVSVLDALRDESKQRSAAIAIAKGLRDKTSALEDLVETARRQSTERLEQLQALRSALDEETRSRKAEIAGVQDALSVESKQWAANIESTAKQLDAALRDKTRSLEDLLDTVRSRNADEDKQTTIDVFRAELGQTADSLKNEQHLLEERIGGIRRCVHALEVQMSKFPADMETELGRLWVAIQTHTHNVSLYDDRTTLPSPALKASLPSNTCEVTALFPALARLDNCQARDGCLHPWQKVADTSLQALKSTPERCSDGWRHQSK